MLLSGDIMHLLEMLKLNELTVISLLVGLVIGGCAQASRMCFIGGWRDFLLIRDKYLLKGFFAFLITAAVLFFVAHQADVYMQDYPWYTRPAKSFSVVENIVMTNDIIDGKGTMIVTDKKNYEVCSMTRAPMLVVGEDIILPGLHLGSIYIPNEILISYIAAFLVGLFSTFANGCPLRQHVMAASGNMSAVLYLLTFYAAVLFYDNILVDFINGLLY